MWHRKRLCLHLHVHHHLSKEIPPPRQLQLLQMYQLQLVQPLHSHLNQHHRVTMEWEKVSIKLIHRSRQVVNLLFLQRLTRLLWLLFKNKSRFKSNYSMSSVFSLSLSVAFAPPVSVALSFYLSLPPPPPRHWMCTLSSHLLSLLSMCPSISLCPFWLSIEPGFSPSLAFMSCPPLCHLLSEMSIFPLHPQLLLHLALASLSNVCLCVCICVYFFFCFSTLRSFVVPHMTAAKLRQHLVPCQAILISLDQWGIHWFLNTQKNVTLTQANHRDKVTSPAPPTPPPTIQAPQPLLLLSSILAEIMDPLVASSSITHHRAILQQIRKKIISLINSMRYPCNQVTSMDTHDTIISTVGMKVLRNI